MEDFSSSDTLEGEHRYQYMCAVQHVACCHGGSREDCIHICNVNTLDSYFSRPFSDNSHILHTAQQLQPVRTTVAHLDRLLLSLRHLGWSLSHNTRTCATFVPPGTHLVPTWHPPDTHLVPTCYPPGTHLVPTRYPTGTHLVPTRYPTGAHLLPTCYPPGTHLLPIWYPPGAHPVPTWYLRSGSPH